MTAPACTIEAFDRAALHYDEGFSKDPVARLMRKRVWDRLEARLHHDSLLLDVGCGTGADAIHLAHRGHAVIAADSSETMLQVLARKLDEDPEARGLVRIHHLDASRADSWEGLVRDAGLHEGALDLIYANFGAVNCLPDLSVLARQADRLLARRGALVLVPMPRHCPWELLSAAWRGRWAFRRLARPGRGVIEGIEIPVRYPTLSALRRAMGPGFRIVRSIPLSLVMPASPLGSALPPHVRSLLHAIDGAASRLPVLRGMGDHVIVEMERR